jgi:uncharacterized coiled-coil DUF342 family protein
LTERQAGDNASVDSAPSDAARRAQLEAEERSLSARRRRLHDRIDFIRSGRADPSQVDERLQKLLDEEREVSARRRQLHAEIDELRGRAAREASAGE